MNRPLSPDEIAKLAAARERKQRWRERRRTGCFIVPIEMSGDLLDSLTAAGWLTDQQTYDREVLAGEILGLLELLGRQRRREARPRDGDPTPPGRISSSALVRFRTHS
jgi:hypothetical protein